MTGVVPIFERVQTSFAGSSLLRLNQNGLKNMMLCPAVADRKVCIVSVAGAFRTGKSFILNFFIRYLKHMSINQNNNGCSNDWLDPNGIVDGFHWRGGTKPDTDGILMWPEPFIVRNEAGEEVVVLLMDTQGVIGGTSANQKEVISIFSLSLLMSSVQVINISHQVQPNCLEQLQLCINNAMSCLNSASNPSSTPKPFQSLVFLIRDYENGQECGLKEMLEETFPISPTTPSNQRNINQCIRNSFEGLRWCLMPPPGEKVTGLGGGNDFKGMIKEIDQRFVDVLRAVIPQLFSANHLPLKRINAKTTTGREIYECVLEYARTLESNGGVIAPIPQAAPAAASSATAKVPSNKQREELPEGTTTSDIIKQSKDTVWTHFWSATVEGVQKLVCKLCLELMGKNSGTTTLIKHLLRQHSDQEDVWFESADKGIGRVAKVKEQMQNEGKPKKSINLNPQAEKYQDNDPRQEDLEGALSLVLSIPNLSINVITHPFIQSFIRQLDPKFNMPSSNGGLRSILSKTYTAMVELIKEELSGMDVRCSVCLDIWDGPSKSKSYLGVVVHFIKAGVRMRRVLGLVHLVGRHTAVAIRTEVHSLLVDFGMDPLQDVFLYLTDWGANVLAAVRPGSRIVEIEVPAEMADEPETEEVGLDGGIGIDSEEAREEDDLLAELDPDSTEEELITGYMRFIRGVLTQMPTELMEIVDARNLPCFSHAMNLVFIEFVDKVLAQVPAYSRMIAIHHTCRQSPQALQKVIGHKDNQQHKRLLSFSSTRWLYTIELMERYLELIGCVKDVFSGNTYKPAPPADEDEKVLRSFHTLLEPLHAVNIEAQNEKMPTLNNCYGYIQLLMNHATKIKKQERSLGREAKALFDILLVRFAPFLDVNSKNRKGECNFNPSYACACLVDSRWKGILSEEMEGVARGALENMVVLDTVPEPEPEVPRPNKSSLDPQPSKKQKYSISQEADKLISSPPQRQWTYQSSGRDVMKRELVAHALGNMPIYSKGFLPPDMTTHWHQRIHSYEAPLAKVALELLNAPSTSASAERLFSVCKVATQAQRNRTGTQLLNYKTVIHSNLSLKGNEKGEGEEREK